jgi:ABC-type enterochelin transport system substrate-binding protein
MRKYTYFLVLVAVIAMSACGNNESTTEKGKTDSTTVATDSASTNVVDSTKEFVDTTKCCE